MAAVKPHLIAVSSFAFVVICVVLTAISLFCRIESNTLQWHHQATCFAMNQHAVHPTNPLEGSNHRRPIHTAIIGGGIIGLCSAWYALTSKDLPKGSTVTVVENSRLGLYQGASSSGGGFIAGGKGSDWQDEVRMHFRILMLLAVY